MPTFYYTAKTQEGKTKAGTIEAKDEHTLAQILREKGCVLTSAKSLEIEEKKPSRGWSALGGKIGLARIFKKVSLVDKLMFTRHLAVMVGAGFSLNQGLEVLAKQTENQSFRKILTELVQDIKKGQALADSLSKYPRIFNEFFVSMIRVAEKGGNLEEVLNILARHLKEEHDLRSKIKGAMFYPAVILVAMIGIAILMMVVVIPKLTVIFTEMNFDLPITTRILIGISNFLSNYLFIGAIAFLILIIALGKLSRTKQGKKVISLVSLKMPVYGKIIKKINCARFARSFSSLMESGVPVVDSLQIVSRTVTNTFYSRSLVETANEIKEGKKIQESLEKYKELYPVLVSQMIGVGEQTGELSDILGRLADFYEEEVKNITENLTSIIEPVLMIILGGAVAFFAISVIQPMYSMMQGL